LATLATNSAPNGSLLFTAACCAAFWPCQLPIRRHAPAIALVAHHRNLAVEAAKIVDQRGKVIAHLGSGYSIFDSGPHGKQDDKWLFPKEKTTLHDSRTKTSESEMLSFMVAAAG
jgi:hypothetical protein